MEISHELIMKGAKFAVVGATSFGVDFGTLYVCKEKFKINKYISNTISFILSATVNFCLNRAWSFDNHDPNVGTQAMKFAVSMTIGFLIAMGALYVFSDKMKLNFYFSKLLSVSIAMIWNFSMANLVIFSHN
ncbi:MAG: GtrA family protein [Bacteroidetes bacterium]|nr:GtrA family protein [Bacteroidota bacterium]